MIKTAEDAYLAGRQAAMVKLSISTEEMRDYFRKDLEKRKEHNFGWTKALLPIGAIGGLAFGRGRGRLINALKGAGALGLGGGLSVDLSRPGMMQKRIEELEATPDDVVEKRYNMIQDFKTMMNLMGQRYGATSDD